MRREYVAGVSVLAFLASATAITCDRILPNDSEPTEEQVQYSDLETMLTGEEQWAVVLVDMQQYFTRDVPSEELYTELKHQTSILKRAKEHDVPILMFEYRDDVIVSSTDYRLSNLLDGYHHGTTVQKKDDNGFNVSKTSIDAGEWLKEHDVTHLYIMGLRTSGCIARTAEGAYGQGFVVATSPDVVMDQRMPLEFFTRTTDISQRAEDTFNWFYDNGMLFENNYQFKAQFPETSGSELSLAADAGF